MSSYCQYVHPPIQATSAGVHVPVLPQPSHCHAHAINPQQLAGGYTIHEGGPSPKVPSTVARHIKRSGEAPESGHKKQ